MYEKESRITKSLTARMIDTHEDNPLFLLLGLVMGVIVLVPLSMYFIEVSSVYNAYTFLIIHSLIAVCYIVVKFSQLINELRNDDTFLEGLKENEKACLNEYSVVTAFLLLGVSIIILPWCYLAYDVSKIVARKSERPFHKLIIKYFRKEIAKHILKNG